MEGDCSGGEGRKAGEESAGRSAEDGRDTLHTPRSHGRCAASERRAVSSARGPGRPALAGDPGDHRHPRDTSLWGRAGRAPQRTGAKPAQRGPRQATCACLRGRLPRPTAPGPQARPATVCTRGGTWTQSHTHVAPPSPKTGTNRMEVYCFTGHRTFTLLNTLHAWPTRAPRGLLAARNVPSVLTPLG